jgi:hypothetical protein
MKYKGLVTILVVIIMAVTVTVCEEPRGMEHLEDNHTKCVIVSKKVTDKKRYPKG